jgi:hypothetical protein
VPVHLRGGCVVFGHMARRHRDRSRCEGGGALLLPVAESDLTEL